MTAQEYNSCVVDYSDSVYRFVLKQIRDEASSKDVIQDSYEKLWINRDKVEFQKAKTYLFTIVYRTMIDHIRRRKLNHEKIKHLSTNISVSSNYERQDLIEKSLSEINEIQRTLVLLRDYEGYSYDEIAKITGIKLSQVKVYLFRARKKLSKILTKLTVVI